MLKRRHSRNAAPSAVRHRPRGADVSAEVHALLRRLGHGAGLPAAPRPPVKGPASYVLIDGIRHGTWRPGGNLVLSKDRADAVTGSLDRIGYRRATP